MATMRAPSAIPPGTARSRGAIPSTASPPMTATMAGSTKAPKCAWANRPMNTPSRRHGRSWTSCAGAPAQLVQDLPCLLDGVFIGRFAHAHFGAFVDPAIVAVLGGEAVEGIAPRLRAVLGGIAEGARIVALRHLLGEGTRRLLQRVERLGLRPDRMAGPVVAQRLGRALHGALGARQRRRNLAARLAELAHQIAERTLERFLLVRVAVACARLRAAGLARLPEAAVEELLLAVHQILHGVERAAPLALHRHRPRAVQILEQLLELGQHVARLVARPGARQLAGAVEQLLQIIAGESLRRVRRLLRLRIILSLLGERRQVAVDLLMQE